MIPSALTLPDVQAAFREVQRAIQPLSSGPFSLNGRRISDAGKPIGQFDYVRKYDLDQEVTRLEEKFKAKPESSVGEFQVVGGAPRFLWREADATRNNKLWDFHLDNQTLALRTRTDDDQAGASALTIVRSGTSISSITLPLLTLTAPLGLASGGTGVSLSSPGADRILFWDQSAASLAWLTTGNSIAITGTTLDAIQDIRTSASPVFVSVQGTTRLIGGLSTLASGLGYFASDSDGQFVISGAGTGVFPYIYMKAMRGSHSSPLKVESGDTAMYIAARMYNGSAFQDTAAITAVIAGATTSGQRPASELRFSTNINNASPAERGRFTSDGLFSLGGGGSSSFPALKRSGNELHVRLADDSGYAPIDAAEYKVAGNAGDSGTFEAVGGEIITVTNGIITDIS